MKAWPTMSGDAAMALDFEGKWNPFVKKMESQNYSGDFALLRAMALNAKALDLTLLHRLVASVESHLFFPRQQGRIRFGGQYEQHRANRPSSTSSPGCAPDPKNPFRDLRARIGS